MSGINFKPCPFCGGEFAEISSNEDLGNVENCVHPGYFTVVCNYLKGGCGAQCGGEYKTPEEAAEAWNRRTVGQKKGRWISDKVAFYWKCSECGVCVRAAYDEVTLGMGRWNYCPNCGADMRGADDDIS